MKKSFSSNVLIELELTQNAKKKLQAAAQLPQNLCDCTSANASDRWLINHLRK